MRPFARLLAMCSLLSAAGPAAAALSRADRVELRQLRKAAQKLRTTDPEQSRALTREGLRRRSLMLNASALSGLRRVLPMPGDRGMREVPALVLKPTRRSSQLEARLFRARAAQAAAAGLPDRAAALDAQATRMTDLAREANQRIPGYRAAARR